MNKLIDSISPFIVMEILEEAQRLEKEGQSIIHLEVGEPDFDLPKPIQRASEAAIHNGHSHYTHSMGDLELRKEIAKHYRTKYNVAVDYNQVLVTGGSSQAILLTLMALINRDDEVMITDPGYACYENFIKIVHGKPIPIRVNKEDGFQIHKHDVEQEMSDRTKAIIINSPMNPTGNLLTDAQMKALAELDTYIISDEIYHGLVYEGHESSILQFTDRAFVINGFSKTFSMTGLRLGYVICPKSFIRPMQILQQNLFICANSIAQQCGIEALRNCDKEVEAMRLEYNQRRLYMVDRLTKMGFHLPAVPTGAFYVFVDASQFSTDSYKFAFDILHHAKVGVTPGIDFGLNGEGFLRFSYANSIQNIEEGMNRLEQYLNELKK